MLFLAGWIFIFAYLGGFLAILFVFFGWLWKQGERMISSLPKSPSKQRQQPISRTIAKPKPVTPKDQGFIL